MPIEPKQIIKYVVPSSDWPSWSAKRGWSPYDPTHPEQSPFTLYGNVRQIECQPEKTAF